MTVKKIRGDTWISVDEMTILQDGTSLI